MQEIVKCKGCGTDTHPEFLNFRGLCQDCRGKAPGNTIDYQAKCPFCGEQYGHRCKEPSGHRPGCAVYQSAKCDCAPNGAIDPGAGCRWLAPEEIVIEGDEYVASWMPDGFGLCTEASIGKRAREHFSVRRSIEPSPSNQKPQTPSTMANPRQSQSRALKQPMFERRALATIGRVTSTFGQRGSEYGDTMRDCQWLWFLAAARKLGYSIDPKHARALAIAGMVDIKYQRMQGGWKDDNGIDGIAYAAFECDEMRELLGGVK